MPILTLLMACDLQGEPCGQQEAALCGRQGGPCGQQEAALCGRQGEPCGQQEAVGGGHRVSAEYAQRIQAADGPRHDTTSHVLSRCDDVCLSAHLLSFHA